MKTKVADSDPGFKRLGAMLGEMGSITLGVQGKEALEKHPHSHLTVGELAAAHELGIVPNAPARSWLRVWLDANNDRMRRETAAKLAEVLAGKTTRNKALQELGYKWTDELRKNLANGNITPPLAEYTIKKKGHDIPLLETATLVNAITYKVYLPMKKSILDAAQRAAAFRKR